MKYDDEIIKLCKRLYIRRYPVNAIAKQTGVTVRTVYYWINQYEWEDHILRSPPLDEAQTRLSCLISLEDKEPCNYKEIETLLNVIDKLAVIEIKKKQKHENKSAYIQVKNGSASKKKKRGKNDFSGIETEELNEAFMDGLYQFQKDERKYIEQRTRTRLKARQIGFTFYYAKEALFDAIKEARNKIMISASRRQSDIFRKYMISFAKKYFDVELKGIDSIDINSNAGTCSIDFLSANAITSMGFSGDPYFDEFFWLKNFEYYNKLVSAVATRTNFRRTYFSTPSSKAHPAYKMWSGEKFNDEMRRQKKALMPLPSFKKMQSGILGPDNHHRKIITVHDAIKGGLDCINIDELKIDFPGEEFLQLFECKFIDDINGVFSFSELQECGVESVLWSDFKPETVRPYSRPVWLGYDPARLRDGASIVIVAPPKKPGGKFRVLEVITLKNCSWAYQVEVIENLLQKYTVEYVGVDITGQGSSVFESVEKIYPNATPIHYSLESKTRMVLKAQDVIGSNRIEWDAAQTDIPSGFLQIRRAPTRTGQMTYVADRNNRTLHADAAWAVMHTLINEELSYRHKSTRKSTWEFSK